MTVYDFVARAIWFRTRNGYAPTAVALDRADVDQIKRELGTYHIEQLYGIGVRVREDR